MGGEIKREKGGKWKGKRRKDKRMKGKLKLKEYKKNVCKRGIFCRIRIHNPIVNLELS